MGDYVPLPGSKRLLLPNSRPAGPIDTSEVDSITVRVRSAGDTEALEKKVNEQTQLPLQDRTYITREELAQPHGASAEDLDKVEQLAQHHNPIPLHHTPPARSTLPPA